MYAVVGTLFLAAAGVVSAWAYVQFRNPAGRRWTENELLIMAITLAELTLLTSGMAHFGRFLLDSAGQPFGPADAAMIAVFAAVFVVSILLMRSSWRVRRRPRARVRSRNRLRYAEPRDANVPHDPRRRRGGEPVRSGATARGRRRSEREAA